MDNLEKAFKEIFDMENDCYNGGGKTFPYEQFKECETIARQLVVKPLVFPTTIGTIMFQFQKDETYLELHFFPKDINRVNGFIDFEKETKTYNFSEDTLNKINEVLKKYFV